jgi:glucose/mannose-6-phosphate isomerase
MTTMKTLVQTFDQQLIEALDLTKNLQTTFSSKGIQHIVISGLGGSGIGGSFMQDFLQHAKCNIPVTVNKDYDVPAWMGEHTLFIACSYSGNTEETLEAVAKAAKKNAKIACITSGGKLMQIAIKKEYPTLSLPGGYPPRSAFGFSSVSLLKMLQMFGFIKDSYQKEVYEAIAIISSEAKNIEKQAKTVAKKLFGKQIFMYCGNGNEAITVRFRQQLNENSKVLACHHVYPEMNHNEYVGWRSKEAIAVVNLFNGFEHKRTLARFEITKPVIKKYVKEMIDIHAQGKGFITRSLYLVHLCDMISVELADLRKVDATEVKVIDHLKNALTAVK